jgi:hypothetical protein
MIKLQLTVEECNLILRSLGKNPFDEVVALIGKIKAQGEPQVAAAKDAIQPEAANADASADAVAE